MEMFSQSLSPSAARLQCVKQKVCSIPGPCYRDHIYQSNPGSIVAASIATVSKTVAHEIPFISAGEIINELVLEYIPTNEPFADDDDDWCFPATLCAC